MKRVWVGVLAGILIANGVAGNDVAAKKHLVIEEVPSQPPQPAAAIQPADQVHVRVGSGNVLTFPSKVIRVAVGDEKIVAVHVVEARQILLQGLMPGRSTVFAWLEDGRRLRYDLIVSPRVEVLESALHDLDPRIVVDASSDSSTLILSGRVEDEHVANQARQLAETMLGTSANGASRVVSLMQFPGSNDADLRLTSALAAVDPRIRLRRMQVGNKVSNTADAVVLEGRVKDIPSLVRAITLAELQLGGVGGKIEPLSNEAPQSARNRNFSGSGGLQRLQGNESPASGLASFVARGLILKSASGRVLSFLEVDELPQIMVSIRVLQVDRGRAKRLGIDYRLDGSDFSAASLHQPGRTSLPAPAVPPDKQTIAGILGGNIVGTFVNRTLAVAAAIDFLQQRDVARSVAEPNITTLSGESASVLIGGEVPIPTTTVGNTASVQGFLFQDFGVRLDIRPTLAPSGLVAMEISPSIIRPSSDLAVSGVPGFQVQSVQTTAKVAPGQTLVLGGLISFNDEIQKRGVPGLSEIPLMKHLFSWEGRTLQEQEILFVITPRILSEGPDDIADAIQWRDVEPITFGAVVELPSADLDSTANIGAATLGHDGLPPSFTKSSRGNRRNTTNPAIIEDHAPPPPPPPSHSMGNALPPVPVPDIAPRYEAPARVETQAYVETKTSVPEPQKELPKETPINEAVKTNTAPAQSSRTAVMAPASPSSGPSSSQATSNPASANSASMNLQSAPVIVHPEPTAIALDPVTPEPAVVATNLDVPKPAAVEGKTGNKRVDAPLPVVKPATAKAQPVSSKPASVPSAPPSIAEKKPLPEKKAPAAKEVAKVPEPKPAQTAIAHAQNNSSPAPATVAATKPASQPIVKSAPPPVPSSTLTAHTATALPTAVTQPPAKKPEPEKATLVATHPSTPSGSPAASPKKIDPAPSVASAQVPHAAAAPPTAASQSIAKPVTPQPQPPAVTRQPNAVTSTAVAQKKSEPAPQPSSAPVVRSVTSASVSTTPPATMPRQTEKPVAQKTPVQSATPQGAAKDGPVPSPQTKIATPASMPATPAYPYRKAPEPDAPPAATGAASKPGGVLASAKVNDEISARLTRDYQIEVVVSPHPGDAWTRLSKRLTGDARHWQELARINGADETLTSEAHVKVPFEMLRPELQQEVIGKLLPKGSAAESDWKRMSGQH